MAFGDAFSSFLTGFQQGYGFVEAIKDKQTEREYQEARTTALEEEYSPENIEMKRRESEARTRGIEATAAVNEQQANFYPQEMQAKLDEYKSQQQERRSMEPYRAATTRNIEAEATTREYANAKEAQRMQARQRAWDQLGFDPGPSMAPKTAIPEPGAVTPQVTPGQQSMGYSANPVAAADMPAHRVALLNTIAMYESAGKYNIRYTPKGGVEFNDLSKHPAIFEPTLDGKDQSSAAGRYQFTKTTWDEMGGGAFTPENQDKRAWELAAQRYRQQTGDDLDRKLQEEGMDASVVQALAPTWEAFRKNDPNKYVTAYNTQLQTVGNTATDAVNAMAGANDKRLSAPDAPWIQAAHEATRSGMMFAAESMGMAQQGVPTQESEAAADLLLSGGAAAAPEEVERLSKITRGIAKEQGGKRPSLAQENMMNLSLLWYEKSSEGDLQGANAAAAELIQHYQMAFNSYASIARAAAEDKELTPAIKAMVKAQAYIPDGVDFNIDERDGKVFIQKIDTASGESLGEEVMMPPEEFFTLVTKVEPKTFIDAVVGAAGEREARITRESQAAMNAVAGPGAVPDEMVGQTYDTLTQARLLKDQNGAGGEGGRRGEAAGAISENVSNAVDQTIEAMFGAAPEGSEPPIAPEVVLGMKTATQIMSRDDPNLMPNEAAAWVMELVRVDETNPDKPQFIYKKAPNGNGIYTLINENGEPIAPPKEFSPAADSTIQRLRGRMYQEAATAYQAAQQPGLMRRIGGAIAPYLPGPSATPPPAGALPVNPYNRGYGGGIGAPPPPAVIPNPAMLPPARGLPTNPYNRGYGG